MLSQNTGYAVKALAFIAAGDGGPVLVRAISEGTDLPGAYLGKIVHTLARRRLVLTRRGPGGGVSLARPPEAISLYDVCRALDDPLTEERCMLSDEPCSEARSCPAHQFCQTHRAQQLDFLRRTTLVDVVQFDARRLADATPARDVRSPATGTSYTGDDR
jgi:Rrf2 family transcriptional regulator, iron-sulfur cluster assembly transcription factor